MSDSTNWTDRREGDFPSKDPQKGTPTDEFIEPDPNRNAPDSNSQPANAGNSISSSDDNPIMGTENTFNDTDPNRYHNNAGLGNPDKEEENKENKGDTDTIGIP